MSRDITPPTIVAARHLPPLTPAEQAYRHWRFLHMRAVLDSAKEAWFAGYDAGREAMLAEIVRDREADTATRTQLPPPFAEKPLTP